MKSSSAALGALLVVLLLGCQGLLGAAASAASLTRLVLEHCELLDIGDATEVLAAACAQLPAGLEHLSINNIYSSDGEASAVPHRRIAAFSTSHLPTNVRPSGKGP